MESSEDNINLDSLQDLLCKISESILMDFVEIWADQRDNECQRLNAARITNITLGDRGGLHLSTVWHVWEKEEITHLRGGYFEHTKTTVRKVFVPFAFDRPVHNRQQLSEALDNMQRIASQRLPLQ